MSKNPTGNAMSTGTFYEQPFEFPLTLLKFSFFSLYSLSAPSPSWVPRLKAVLDHEALHHSLPDDDLVPVGGAEQEDHSVHDWNQEVCR